jgi:hypothetical protein
MPRKTAGRIVPKSAKQIAAATKTILAFEKAQAYKNRVSDNLEIFSMGFLAGACLIYIIHVLVS